MTPLLLAAKNGHTNVVKILLQHDVEISLRNSYGRNFLCEAIINGHQYVPTYMLTIVIIIMGFLADLLSTLYLTMIHTGNKP